METLWKIDNLGKKYLIRSGAGVEEVTALESVSMDISEGETFGLIGESGSGKTTLGKTILRLVEPTYGKVYFRGIELTDLKDREVLRLRRNFQIVFQDPYSSLNPRMTVGGAVMEGVRGKSSAERRDRVKEIFETVGISPERINEFPHQFSGGEKQRVSIARALSTSPVFIVCDEPTSNLDLSIQAKILNLFIELKEKMNLTYLFISHDIKIIEFISDRVAVMYRGEVVETGTTEKVIKNPLHPYTELLIRSSLYRGAETGRKRYEPSKNGCRFLPSCPYSKEVCRTERPILRQVEEGHSVACFRY
jgi:oligopeptide/dipeptide ABC transporter ATP-binding protein